MLDVLVPTRDRPAELAVTLAGLAAQYPAEPATAGGPAPEDGRSGSAAFGVVVSDQSDGKPGWAAPAAAAMVRVLRHRGHPVLLTRRLPRRGLAEHRAYLLDASAARYVLFLDDDVWLEPGTVDRLLTAIRELDCGFVGNAVHGLSYLDDVRPETHRHYVEWTGRPVPERLRPGTPEWLRARIHSAANLLHVTRARALPAGQWRAYKVSWIGGCVLYDRSRLCAAGGFDFWPRLDPGHQGEDVAAQLAVLAEYAGAGILPSGAYHLEAPTTVTERTMEAWEVTAGRSDRPPPPAPPPPARR
ncbi:glycosyltransferase family 2 protein [Plantactinospora sp. WMMB782]|uniref:glycosyltransferase family 2 protein n=1 Tax=Plantactinospora sp. WMMB782 TaxID=3404121 RepID=UPI003B944480